MEYLNILAYIFGYGATAALSFWLARTLFVYYQNIKQVETIHKQEAKVAVLRMLLKAKLKKNGNAIEGQFRSDKIFLNLIKPKIQEICNYDFSHQNEYERVMASLINLYDVIDVELQKRSPTLYKKNENETRAAVDDKQDRWYKLAKYGKSQAILIRDMVNATAELKSMIDTYNREQQSQFKNKFNSPEPIVVADFESLTTILNSMEDSEQVEFEERKAA